MGAIKISTIKRKGEVWRKVIVFPECALCNESKELVESHVISKMFYRWIKKTTKNKVPRFRSMEDEISQDGYKIYLLCSDCEQEFSRYETYFSSVVYQPTIKNIKVSINYDERLLMFIVSLGWRFLYVYLQQKPDAPTYLNWYERHWKEYLRGKVNKIKTNHFIVPSHIQIDDEIINDYLDFFIYRSVGYGLSNFDDHDFIWIQIPFYTIVFPLRPLNFKGYDSCKIKNEGILKLNQPHIVYQPEFSLSVFILNMCKKIFDKYDIQDEFKGSIFSD